MSAPAAELAYLSRALKAPRIRAVWGRLAERARDEGWDYAAYLAAVLTEEVSARDSHGGSARVKAARFPAIKTIDDFDFTIQTSVSRQVIRPPRPARLPGRGQERRFPRTAGHGQDPSLHRARRPGRPARPCRLRYRPQLGQPPRRGQADGQIGRRARAAVTSASSDRRRGGLHPLRPGGGGAVLCAGQLALRAALADRVVEQDLQCLGRALRRPGGRAGAGRPARPPRRGDRGATMGRRHMATGASLLAELSTSASDRSSDVVLAQRWLAATVYERTVRRG